MTLADQGFRYYASPDRTQYRWIHPATVSLYPDWIDTTDMGDGEFLAFVLGA